MSWLFSQVLVEEYSPGTCWDGAPCAPLNVMPTQHKFWRNDRPMEHSRLSQFGLTCALLTADLGEELLTWFREDFLARTYQPQDKGLELKASDLLFGGEMARIVREVRPSIVFLENSPMLVGRGLAMVLGELTEMGYDSVWGVMGAANLGAPHKRDRIWLVARDKQQEDGRQNVANSSCEYVQRLLSGSPHSQIRYEPMQRPTGPCSDGFRWWSVEPRMGRVADGVAYRVDRAKALGNGQVPVVAATVFSLLVG